MLNKLDIIKTLVVIGIMMIIFGLVLIVVDETNKERCSNLPLNDYFKDIRCKKYYKLGEYDGKND